MQESRPSRTALRVALRRAAHQVYDARPLVLEDPLAVRVLRRYAEELARTPGQDPEAKARPFSVGLRAFLVARSRLAEDLLAQAAARGVRQYCLLGAGLDTFAHRNPHAGVRVFEVDHAPTQAWKRELLAEARMAHPDGLTYVPVDFERDAFGERLAQAGHDAAQPTFFAWLGVVPYLTREAFHATLATVRAQARGSGVVFDYAQPREALPYREQLAHDSLAERVQLAGEPFRLFLTPVQAAAELSGFQEVEDLGSAELNVRYFAGRADELRLRGTAGRIVSGWVG